MKEVELLYPEVGSITMSLDKEFAFFKAHQEEFATAHHGKYLLIHGEVVIGAFDSELEAYTEGKKQFQPGTFLIQQALHATEEKPQVFHSRVVIKPRRHAS